MAEKPHQDIRTQPVHSKVFHVIFCSHSGNLIMGICHRFDSLQPICCRTSCTPFIISVDKYQDRFPWDELLLGAPIIEFQHWLSFFGGADWTVPLLSTTLVSHWHTIVNFPLDSITCQSLSHEKCQYEPCNVSRPSHTGTGKSLEHRGLQSLDRKLSVDVPSTGHQPVVHCLLHVGGNTHPTAVIVCSREWHGNDSF